MATYRIISVFDSGSDKTAVDPWKNIDKYSIANKYLSSLEIEYESPKLARIKVNPTCCFRAPLGYFGDENYDFKDASNFEVEERGHWFLNKCRQCGWVINSPMKIEDCIACETGKCDHASRSIGKLTRNPKELNSTWEANPELVAQAQQDLAENPVPGTNDSGVDWGHLRDNL